MNGPSILGLLLRRKRLLLLSGVATAVFGFGVSKVLPRSYGTEGSLIVENRTTANDGPASPTALSNVLTQVDVLQTKGLAERIVRDLDLVHVDTLQPSFGLPAVVTDTIATGWNHVRRFRQMLDGSTPTPAKDEFELTIQYVQKHLSVSAAENSSVITVKFEAGSPTTAAMVSNTAMGTYLTTIGAGREAQIAKTNAWIEEQIGIRKAEVADAERRVTDYVRSHSLPEVQQSPTTSIQLSKDQEQLVRARDELAKAQAALDTTSAGTVKQTSEVLESKTIQSLKEFESKLIEQLALLTQIDPRRGPLLEALNGVRKQLVTETGLIYASLQRKVEVARANVAALERQIQQEQQTAEQSTLNTAEYKQLSGDLDAKRQLYVAFLTQAGQARVAAEQQPTAHVLFQAQPPEKPLHNFGLASILIGFLGGIFGCAGVLTLKGVISPKINSNDDIKLLTGIPVFGVLPDVKRGGLLTAPKTTSLVTETFRAMWVALRPQENEGTAILITSSETGEGKTTVAAAMARRFSEDGYRVLLIDADLRHPSVAHALGLPRHKEPAFGATDSLERGVVQVTDNLSCLLLGRVENPVKIFSSDRFAELLAASRRSYDFVILDSPPVLHVADSLLLAGLCQHVIFVVQAGRLQADIVGEAIRRFSPQDREKIQTLLTRVRRGELDRRDYYSGYERKVA